jgi:hypothetical protein
VKQGNGCFLRAQERKQENACKRKEQEMPKPRNSKWLISGLILTGALGLGGAKVIAADNGLHETSADGVLSKTQLKGGNYCHLRFPAIRPSTVGTAHPQLKSATTGDIVDFYGPCQHDPLGKNEVANQEQEDELRWENNYDS